MKKRFLVTILMLPLIVNAQIITTVCGIGISGEIGDGTPATNAKISAACCGIFDKYDNYYFSEGPGNRIRKISSSGIISAFAGIGGIGGFSGDNGPASSCKLNYAKHLAADSLGNIYIADEGNSRIRKVDHTTGIITTIAGGNVSGCSGDGGQATAASIGAPYGICFDPFGNLYFTDQTYNVIRKVNTSGIIVTIAGTAGFGGTTGDGGPATAALLSGMEALCSDKLGNIYIACGNVRKIDFSTGIITSIAGHNYIFGYTGENVRADTAEIEPPFDLKTDTFGNLYLSERNNNRIRKIDTSGYLHTIVGNGIGGYVGDGGLATLAEINWPEGVGFDICGNLWFNDLQNYRIRKVNLNPACVIQSDSSSLSVQSVIFSKISIYPNPAYSSITISCTQKIKQIMITNFMGEELYTGVYDIEKAEVNIAGLPEGVFVVRVTDDEGSVTMSKFVKQ